MPPSPINSIHVSTATSWRGGENQVVQVIDHHRSGRGRKPKCQFCDIRTDVGATTSIIFSYFMELDAPITPELAAIMLYAIESDLAGAAFYARVTLGADRRKVVPRCRRSATPLNWVRPCFVCRRSLLTARRRPLSHIGGK